MMTSPPARSYYSLGKVEIELALAGQMPSVRSQLGSSGYRSAGSFLFGFPLGDSFSNHFRFQPKPYAVDETVSDYPRDDNSRYLFRSIGDRQVHAKNGAQSEPVHPPSLEI